MALKYEDGLAALLTRVSTLMSGKHEIYMEMADYISIEDQVYKYAWQYRRGTLSDSRVTVIFKLLPGDMKWYWMRHSISHPAKMSVVLAETTDGVIEANGGSTFDSIITNPDFQPPSKEVLAKVLGAVEFKELRVQLFAKEAELEEMAAIAEAVGTHSPHIADDVLKRVPGYQSEIEVLKIALGDKDSIEELPEVIPDIAATLGGVCKVCGRDTVIIVKLALCEECNSNKYDPLNFLDNSHKVYDPVTMQSSIEKSYDDDDDDYSDDDDEEIWDDMKTEPIESIEKVLNSVIQLCVDCNTVLEKGSPPNTYCGNCGPHCLICKNEVSFGVKVCGACGKEVTSHPAFDKLSTDCNLCIIYLYNAIAYGDSIVTCNKCGKTAGLAFACAKCCKIPPSKHFMNSKQLCQACDPENIETAKSTASMSKMLWLLENCLACTAKLSPVELATLKALCSKCVHKHITPTADVL